MLRPCAQGSLRATESAGGAYALFHAQQHRRLRLEDRRLMVRNRQQFARMAARPAEQLS